MPHALPANARNILDVIPRFQCPLSCGALKIYWASNYVGVDKAGVREADCRDPIRTCLHVAAMRDDAASKSIRMFIFEFDASPLFERRPQARDTPEENKFSSRQSDRVPLDRSAKIIWWRAASVAHRRSVSRFG